MTVPVRIKLPQPHPRQLEIIQSARKFNVLACGRRFGKSVLGTDRLIMGALQGHPVAWFAPNYRYLVPVWDAVVEALQPLILSANKSEKRIVLTTKGSIDFWTCDGPDPALGRKYKVIVVDEAAIIEKLEYIWTKCLEPTLLDLDGDAWFLSTPRGYNFFHSLWQQGQSEEHPDWASHHAPTVANSTIPNVAAWVERKRKTTVSYIFEQEYEAVFSTGEGAVFRNVKDCATAQVQEKAQRGHVYYIGIDLARHGDFTCCTVFDLNLADAVRVERWTGQAFDIQETRIRNLIERFDPALVLVEKNGHESFVEDLLKIGPNVRPFVTSAQSKPLLIDRLAWYFEAREIGIIPDPVLLAELLSFESTRSASGNLRYSAPSGQHDDTVMSLAIAVHAAEKDEVAAPRRAAPLW